MPLTGTVIVTQPMAVAAGDALRAIKMFEQLNVPILGVVENMSGDFLGLVPVRSWLNQMMCRILARFHSMRRYASVVMPVSR